MVNPLNAGSEYQEVSEGKFFLFYKNKKIRTASSIQEIKQLILQLIECSDSQSDSELDNFTVFKKIPISLELTFEDK